MMMMMMIIFIHKKNILQIMVTNIQHSPNSRMPVESYKKLILLIINLKAIIILIEYGRFTVGQACCSRIPTQFFYPGAR